MTDKYNWHTPLAAPNTCIMNTGGNWYSVVYAPNSGYATFSSRKIPLNIFPTLNEATAYCENDAEKDDYWYWSDVEDVAENNQVSAHSTTKSYRCANRELLITTTPDGAQLNSYHIYEDGRQSSIFDCINPSLSYIMRAFKWMTYGGENP